MVMRPSTDRSRIALPASFDGVALDLTPVELRLLSTFARAPWLAQAQLPEDQQARLAIHVGHAEREPSANELLIYPRSVLLKVTQEVSAQEIGRASCRERV